MLKRAVLLCLCLILIAGCNSKPETDEEKLNALAMSFAKDYCAIFNTGDQKAAEHFISLYDPNAKHKPPTTQSLIKFIRQDYQPDAELSFSSVRNVAVQGDDYRGTVIEKGTINGSDYGAFKSSVRSLYEMLF